MCPSLTRWKCHPLSSKSASDFPTGPCSWRATPRLEGRSCSTALKIWEAMPSGALISPHKLPVGASRKRACLSKTRRTPKSMKGSATFFALLQDLLAKWRSCGGKPRNWETSPLQSSAGQVPWSASSQELVLWWRPGKEGTTVTPVLWPCHPHHPGEDLGLWSVCFDSLGRAWHWQEPSRPQRPHGASQAQPSQVQPWWSSLCALHTRTRLPERWAWLCLDGRLLGWYIPQQPWHEAFCFFFWGFFGFQLWSLILCREFCSWGLPVGDAMLKWQVQPYFSGWEDSWRKVAKGDCPKRGRSQRCFQIAK